MPSLVRDAVLAAIVLPPPISASRILRLPVFSARQLNIELDLHFVFYPNRPAGGLDRLDPEIGNLEPAGAGIVRVSQAHLHRYRPGLAAECQISTHVPGPRARRLRAGGLEGYLLVAPGV